MADLTEELLFDFAFHPRNVAELDPSPRIL